MSNSIRDIVNEEHEKEQRAKRPAMSNTDKAKQFLERAEQQKRAWAILHKACNVPNDISIIIVSPQQAIKAIELAMEPEWISVEDLLPDENETVWLCNNKTGYVSLGCRCYPDPEEGWIWAESNGIIYSNNREIISECEFEDLDITHWHKLMPLPSPPKQDKP